jgi:hypothetical protein
VNQDPKPLSMMLRAVTVTLPFSRAARLLAPARAIGKRSSQYWAILAHQLREVFVKNQRVFSLTLRGIALAMGVAVVVLSVLGTASASTLITLLGIGLFCLGLWALQKGQ